MIGEARSAFSPVVRAPRGLLRALAAPLLLGALLAAPAGAGDDVAKTAHVLARGDVGRERLEAYAALAEACYPHWKAYFRVEPGKDRLPLVVDVRTDRAAWLAALARAGVMGGQALQGAGGYYDPASGVSFLYLQPHDSSTRLLVLHELTHQYQYEAVLGDRTERSPVWHREGLAEHFGFHRRTTAGLEVGVYDLVGIDARPAEVAERVASGTFDAWAVGTGAARNPDYTDALALVGTFLGTKDEGLRRAFRRFEEDLLRGGEAGPKFERAFGPLRARLTAAVAEVWGSFRRTWKVVYVGWDEAPGVLVGKGMPWAFLMGTTSRQGSGVSVAAGVRLGREARAGGIALGVKGPDDLVALEVRAERRIVLRVKRRGRWTDVGGVTLPADPAGRIVMLRLSLRGAAVHVEVDGVAAPDVPWSAFGGSPSDFDGAVGLFAESGEVEFSDVVAGG